MGCMYSSWSVATHKTRAIVFYLPEEVIEWLDKQASASLTTRGRYLRNLIVRAWQQRKGES